VFILVQNHRCGKNSRCVDRLLGYSCLCQEGFTGEFCTTEINECEGVLEPCTNGGTCLDRIGDFLSKLIKKKLKFSLNIRKFRRKQLQSLMYD
jgi:hypothetical protein